MLTSSKLDITKRLNERSILLFFQPAMPHESMNSWICRNALANYSTPLNFIARWINYRAAQNWDFDIKPIKELEEWMLYMSPKRDLADCIDNKSNLILDSFKLAKSKTSPFLKYGTYSELKVFRPQFCPLCLGKRIPYFKIEWKFSLIFGCPECNCYLESGCKNCNVIPQFLKSSFLQDGKFLTINNCNGCTSELSSVQSKMMTKEDAAVTHWLRRVIGFESSWKRDPDTASLIFDLANLFCSNNPLGKCVRDFFSMPSYSDLPFHSQTVLEKAKILRTVKYWIDDFYLITNQINEKYGINRKKWDTVIRIPRSLNP